jgi:hypothetical protein
MVRAGDLRGDIATIKYALATPKKGNATMTDPILSKAMEKRDEALREAERWEQWIRDYEKLAGPVVEALDIPMARKSSDEVKTADELDIATSLRAPPQPAEKANGQGLWPRN